MKKKRGSITFHDRISGFVLEQPVTVDEMIKRLQAFRGNAVVEIWRNQVMIKLAKEKRPEGTYTPVGYLDEPVPASLQRKRRKPPFYTGELQ